MPQNFNAHKAAKSLEKDASQILMDHNNKGALTAMHNELAQIFGNPKEFRAVKAQIDRDNADHCLPEPLARIWFKNDNGTEYLDFTDEKTPLG